MFSEANTVWAMDPYHPASRIRLGCHPQTVSKIVQAGWSSKIGEYWGLVNGSVPPNPHSEAPHVEGIQTLLGPTGVFKGLKRPLHYLHASADRDVLIYVARPPCTFRFKDHKEFGGILEPAQCPVDSVFTTFVSLSEAHIDGALQAMRETPSRAVNGAVAGIVLFWEWTEASPEEEELPFDHQSRYGTRLI